NSGDARMWGTLVRSGVPQSIRRSPDVAQLVQPLPDLFAEPPGRLALQLAEVAAIQLEVEVPVVGIEPQAAPPRFGPLEEELPARAGQPPTVAVRHPRLHDPVGLPEILAIATGLGEEPRRDRERRLGAGAAERGPVVVPVPDRDHQRRRVGDEPGVAPIVRGAGLARERAAP